MNIDLKSNNYIFFYIVLFLFFSAEKVTGTEIVKDGNGNYYIIKEDGSYKKLPPLKPGMKYVLKPKEIKKPKKEIMKKNLRDKSTRSAKRVITRQSF